MPDFYALPKQIDFLKAGETEVLFSGAVRAGKSFVLCLKTVMRAMKPGAREVLVRKTLKALKSTTLKTLLEGDGKTPPILPPGTYTHHKADQTIKLRGGGEIVYFGLVNEGEDHTQKRIGSVTASGVNVDEATELVEKDVQMLVSRPSIKLDGLPMQMNLACNPGPPSHFLAKRFAPVGSGYSKPLLGCRCICTQTSENTFLPPEYLENINRESGTLWHRRFVLGLWCGSDGLVYDRWDRQIHVMDIPGSFKRYVVGCDDGYTNPFCALLAGVDGDGRIHVMSEVYKTGLVASERVERVKKLIKSIPTPPDEEENSGYSGGSPSAQNNTKPKEKKPPECESVVYDPSAADLGAEMRRGGMHCVAADNAVFDGICGVQSRLKVLGDGRPRITISPSCENTIMEMETYEWSKSARREEPNKKNDHAMDALRYLCRYIDGNARTELVNPSWTREHESMEEAINSRGPVEQLIRFDDRWSKWH